MEDLVLIWSRFNTAEITHDQAQVKEILQRRRKVGPIYRLLALILQQLVTL